MNLFEYANSPLENILPYDGVVHYYGLLIDTVKAKQLFETLLREIAWKNDEAVIFGKHIQTKRKAAWYGSDPFEYTYSKITKKALPWTPLLLHLKELVEQETDETYNSCLLNLYHNGSEGMAWHSDGEKDLKKNGAIASLSFGATRNFAFKHKTTLKRINLSLQSGSLLVMKGETQTHWLHRLPPTTRVEEARINLTFRTIVLKND